MRNDPIAIDCDVLCGTWPARAELDFGWPAVRARLDTAGIGEAMVCSGRGAWFDDVEGNTETLALTGAIPVGTINLRNALRAAAIVHRLANAGVRAVRLFGPLQGGEPHFPGYRHVVDQILDAGMVPLVEGDVRHCWQAFADRGARVVFLDVHAYHVADFILLATREPGFVASTRLLNAPDSIEIVNDEVGASHLVFGSRTPLHDTSPAVLRMRRARLGDADWAAVTGGTMRSLLEKS
ncbi:hypothetical protein [Fodinicola feengrottensis]|uniref:Uncharacterized protein n=1 Tax=Fodinicola feengrottensis TaxID=435914 RepID=A0ABN2J7P8_9ACTN|nr:hypothetical protein [Fodinicola feengrottensis]